MMEIALIFLSIWSVAASLLACHFEKRIISLETWKKGIMDACEAVTKVD